MIGRTNVAGSSMKFAAGTISGSSNRNLIISGLDFTPRNVIISANSYYAGAVYKGVILNIASGTTVFFDVAQEEYSPSRVRVTVTATANSLQLDAGNASYWPSAVTYSYIITN